MNLLWPGRPCLSSGHLGAKNPYARHVAREENVIDNARRTEERQAQILSAAARVLSDRGARGLRLADVADEAGVSVGLVQHYFRSRAELLLQTFRSAYQAAAGSLDSLSAEEPDPERRLVKLVRHSIQADRWPIWLEYWGAASREPSIREQCEGEYHRWTGHFFSTIQAGVEDGSFHLRHPVDDVADRLLLLIDGVAVRLLMQDRRFDRDRALTLVGETLRDELGLDANPMAR